MGDEDHEDWMREEADELVDAAMKGKLERVRELLDEGIDINHKNERDEGRAALHAASESEHEDVVRFLLEKRANVNIQDSLGNTPLLYASRYGNEDIARILIDAGANVNQRNLEGRIPLHDASWNGYSRQLVNLLLDKGSNVNAKDMNGWTPLHMASGKDNDDIVRILLKRGADRDAQTKIGKSELQHGDTALHRAVYREYIPTVMELVNAGANTRIKNYEGKTPIDYASPAIKRFFETKAYETRARADTVVRAMVTKPSNVLRGLAAEQQGTTFEGAVVSEGAPKSLPVGVAGKVASFLRRPEPPAPAAPADPNRPVGAGAGPGGRRRTHKRRNKSYHKSNGTRTRTSGVRPKH